MPDENERQRRHDLPPAAVAVLRALLPAAEREEVLSELAEEYRARVADGGRARAWRWLWTEVLVSAPSLARRGWWRGWSGFEPRADRWRPGGSMLESVGKDARFGLRRLKRRPTYTVLAVLTLALGVAGTASVYSVVRQMLLDPLPLGSPERVVTFWSPFDWSEAEFAYVRPALSDFESAAIYTYAGATMQREGEPARLVPGVTGSAELFDVLGVRPALGPGFRPGDDAIGAEPVAVLSHALWTELGASPAILGSRLELSGRPRTVVGVMPEGFWFPEPGTQVWLAEEVDPAVGTGMYIVAARMPAGATIESMAPQLDRLTGMLGDRFDYPQQWDKTENASLMPMSEFLLGSIRPALVAMLAAMALLLLIACVNVSALMLGQLDSRGSELAVRTALGAGRRRIVQQLAIESLAIGVLAGGVGAALAVLGFDFLVDALPLGVLAETPGVDWPLFVAAIVVAIGAATLVAVVPALSVSRTDPQQRLRGARSGGVDERGGRLESGLVVGQVALVLLMAGGAALLIRSVANLRAIDPGLDAAGVGVIELTIPATLETERRPRVLNEIVDAVGSLPGVESAAAAQTLPLREGGNNWGMEVEGLPDADGGTTFVRLVTTGYLETMGMRLVRGRWLEEADRLADDEGAVVINEALSREYFGDADPIGRRIRTIASRWDRVVGVVANVAEGRLTDAAEPARYLHYDGIDAILPGQSLVLRTRPGIDPGSVLDDARRAVHAAAPEIAVRETTTMAAVFERALGPARQVMALLTLLGTLALALGSVGVYGVVSHFVARRKRDLGIRLALGMRPERVVRQVVGRGGALVAAGIALGMLAFIAAARFLAGFLYGVGAADPIALAGAMAVLLAAGLLAAYIPAQRASRVDPALVLRDS